MKEYEFTLRYQVDASENLQALAERLGEAGCEDALIGIGQPGRLALEFMREAASAELAIESALADVHNAVPHALLIEATPGMVGLTDVAELVGVSCQNMHGYLEVPTKLTETSAENAAPAGAAPLKKTASR